jgi:hypothetical protein
MQANGCAFHSCRVGENATGNEVRVAYCVFRFEGLRNIPSRSVADDMGCKASTDEMEDIHMK